MRNFGSVPAHVFPGVVLGMALRPTDALKRSERNFIVDGII
jgi:hypothetical protein